MSVLRSLLARTREMLTRRRLDAELEEEMRFHLEMEAAHQTRRGLSPDEARRAALIAFGGVEHMRERTRDARGFSWIDATARDVRFALRRLARRPGFTVPSTVTLAVGIAVATSVLVLAHAVLVRPLPYPHAERLVALRHTAPGIGLDEDGQSEGTYEHYRLGARSLDAIGAYLENEGVSITDGDEPERIRVAMVTPSLMSMLGATASVGRTFTDADATDDGEQSVMISHALWTRRWGADTSVIGRVIELNRAPRRVLGVVRPGFEFPSPSTQVWYPIAITAKQASADAMYFESIGRLRPGMTAADAERELASLTATLPSRYPDIDAAFLREARLAPLVRPLREYSVRGVRPALLLLVATGALVLVVAWANVATLVSMRAEHLRQEVAVARALGARSSDLARRFLTESFALSAVGGALGLAAAAALIAWRFGLGDGSIPRAHEIRLDAVGVAIAAAITVACGASLGVAALLRVRRSRLTDGGAATGRATANRAQQRAIRALVVTQVSLALTLLVGAGLTARSLRNLQRAELGFDPRDAVTFELSLPFRPYPTYRDAARLQLALLERLRGVPGVVAAEATTGLPLTAQHATLVEPVAATGSDAASGSPAPKRASVLFASPGLFAAMRLPIVAGRTFVPGDARSMTPAVVVSASLARALFGSADPLGRSVQLPAYAARYPSYRVVGVVGDVPGERIEDGAAPAVYFPVLGDLEGAASEAFALPFVPSSVAVVVRTSRGTSEIVTAAREALADLDRQLPIARVRTLERVVADATARARLVALLTGLAAAASLFLGAVGVYGVVSYAVGRRTREIGVRMAFGATPGSVRGLVLRQGAVLAAVGVSIGVVAALGLSRLLRGLVYGVSTTDPVAFGGAAVLLLAAAALASWIPAQRASRVDPARALRAE